MKVVTLGMDTVFHYKTLECKTDGVTFVKSHMTTDKQTTANNIYNLNNFKTGGKSRAYIILYHPLENNMITKYCHIGTRCQVKSLALQLSKCFIYCVSLPLIWLYFCGIHK